MRGTRKFFMISVGCAGVVMALLLTAVLATRLLANREMVKSFIITKTAQTTGSSLDYGRLDIRFLPQPHLKARNVHLLRPDAFEVTTQELSIYPRIIPILTGQLKINHLLLVAPDIVVPMDSESMKTPGFPKGKAATSLEDAVKTAIGGLFSALATVDIGSKLQIEEGTATLAFTGESDLRITGINASVANHGGDLSLNLECRSDLTGKLDVSARADIEAMQASGQITITDINVRPLSIYAALPGDISTEDTRAAVKANFTIDRPEKVHSQFEIQFPTLTVIRKNKKLDLNTLVVSGTVDYAGENLSVAIDTLRSERPALDLSATANLKPTDDPGRFTIEVGAAANQLDVAIADAVTGAVAGDLNEIQTAFSVAKKGHLKNASFFAGFETGSDGFRLTKMKASGRLTQGKVTIPGIEADLERMDGNVIYEDRHVAFKNVSGFFKGVTFQELDAAIDWENESTLTISSPSATVDIAPLRTWLSGFEASKVFNNHVHTVTGKAVVSNLKINGPLTKPGNWVFEISCTPEDVQITSPLVPFAVSLSGGEVTYIPGKERATDVKIKFLDGSFVSSFKSKGIINHASLALRIDGSMGQETLDWFTTILPIPDHLQMKPPIDLTGVNILWDNTNTFSLLGTLKTAGGLDLYTDFTRSEKGWEIRRIQFSDGSSNATVSARKQSATIELAFSGNVEKQTADRLLRNNQTLSGRIKGDFRTVIDTDAPLKSSFTGKLAGKGLHVNRLTSDPIEIKKFSIDGSGGKVNIAPSEVLFGNSLLVVDGLFDRGEYGLTFDLNVDADRLDEEVIRALQSTGKEKEGETVRQKVALTPPPRGTIHVKTNDFTYGGFSWSRVRADIRIDDKNTGIQIHQADLCGISTPGELEFSPRGISIHITPKATDESFEETAGCLWNKSVKADATYDLSGVIDLPPTLESPAQSLSGQLEFSSDNGRIAYSNVLMKIFSVLNITELFTGGRSDRKENGYVYTKAYANTTIEGGKLHFNEILLDGNVLKITGQGSIDLASNMVNISLLAAPLKAVDRVVNTIPIMGYITGRSIVTVPLRIQGEISNPSVVPMAPSSIGQGLLGIMERMLKSPVKMVKSTAELPSEESTTMETAPVNPNAP